MWSTAFDPGLSSVKPVSYVVYENLYKVTVNKSMINWTFLATVETFIVCFNAILMELLFRCYNSIQSYELIWTEIFSILLPYKSSLRRWFFHAFSSSVIILFHFIGPVWLKVWIFWFNKQYKKSLVFALSSCNCVAASK